jgi:UDP-N-acetylmuramate--alanine ligase
VKAIRQNQTGHEPIEYAASSDEAIARTLARAVEGEVILTLGAGSVSYLAPVVLEKLEAKS